MIETVIARLIEQGGFALLCGAILVMYRNDSKAWAARQSESASAFMAFGERTSAALTHVAETMRAQALVLERIEGHLTSNQICPVTQVTTEMLRETAHVSSPRNTVATAVKAMHGKVAHVGETP